jgi:division/cell wall cluster transcriptional repressor MraZ
MLIGEFRHIIDDKKRISMPASFRREIGKKMVITKGLDSCLFAYTIEGWKKVSVEIEKLLLPSEYLVCLDEHGKKLKSTLFADAARHSRETFLTRFLERILSICNPV